MNAYELNKWAGAILGSALVLFLINEIGNFLVHPTAPEKAVIAIELPESEAASKTAADTDTADAGPSLGALLAEADVAKGQKIAKKCITCHTFDKGGKNKIGPNLYGVVGGAKASAAGFSYSGALKGLGGDWTFEDLNAFLSKPKEFAKGTKMAFGGIKKDAARADLIAYLLQFSDSPPALPAK